MTDSTGKPISIRNVSKTYQSASGTSVVALEPVNLEIEAGEFVVIVGPSGCGKSTLLNILAGFSQPTSGEAVVGESRITAPDIDRGMVFQSYALFPWLNVIENVEFGLERKGVSRAERRVIALEYLRSVGLADFAGKQVNELSGGMKQRVAIARAFATEPSVILMDEPFGALDALTRRHLQRQLLQICQAHRRTIVFITHSVPEAIFLADRILVMTASPGKIKASIRINAPHPRQASSAELREIEQDLLDQLDEELVKTFALEGR
ncbi:MAG: ABC transporter ATP-binding protein [Methylibium sp.]|nr:ABC transporter ATP-binding protein [Methylibium sp.]